MKIMSNKQAKQIEKDINHLENRIHFWSSKTNELIAMIESEKEYDLTEWRMSVLVELHELMGEYQ